MRRDADESELRLKVIRVCPGFVFGVIVEPISIWIPRRVNAGPPKEQSFPGIGQPVAIRVLKGKRNVEVNPLTRPRAVEAKLKEAWLGSSRVA